MSAFICDRYTFYNVYAGMNAYGKSGALGYSPIRCVVEKLLDKYGTLEKIIEHLYALNVRAVNQRYAEETEERMPEPMRVNVLDTQWKAPPSLFQFLKSLECLQYQMSEGDVPQQELYTIIDELIKAVALSIAHIDKRYDQAEWG